MWRSQSTRKSIGGFRPTEEAHFDEPKLALSTPMESPLLALVATFPPHISSSLIYTDSKRIPQARHLAPPFIRGNQARKGYPGALFVLGANMGPGGRGRWAAADEPPPAF